jgi:beta-glucosidase
MLAAQSFCTLTLDAAGSTGDYPRGYQVFVSNDGTNWGAAIATGSGSTQLVTITFAAQTARYIKVVQTGSAGNWWSIAELNVKH